MGGFTGEYTGVTSIIIGILILECIVISIKFFLKFLLNDDFLSWKIIGIIQIILIPIFIPIVLFSQNMIISIFIVLTIAIGACVFLGTIFNTLGQKSATEPVEAEIIDINIWPIHDNFTDTTKDMYMLTLKYNVNGIDYINKNLKGYMKLEENMKIGNKMMIKYNPKNPNDVTY